MEISQKADAQKIEYAKELANRLNFNCEVFYHETSGRTTEDAEKALGLDSSHIIKCLLLKSKNNGYIGAIIRGSDRVDFKALESLTGYKGLRMAQESDIERELGFGIGGVPATIFHDKGIRTFVDNRVLEMDYVVGSGGTPHHGMKFSPRQLTEKLGYTLGEIISRG